MARRWLSRAEVEDYSVLTRVKAVREIGDSQVKIHRYSEAIGFYCYGLCCLHSDSVAKSEPLWEILFESLGKAYCQSRDKENDGSALDKDFAQCNVKVEEISVWKKRIQKAYDECSSKQLLR